MELLGGEPIELVVPRSLSERWGVQAAAQDGTGNTQVLLLVGAGALGLCWPRFRYKEDAPRYQHDLLDYGERVRDKLFALGASARDIERWSLRAYRLCVDGLISGADVKAARAFSGVPTEAERSPSSESSARGDSSPDGSAPSTATPQHS